MSKVAFISSSEGGVDSVKIEFDGTRSALDGTRLQTLIAASEPKTQSDTWLVQTGRDLFQLLGIKAEDVAAERILQLDFTGLDAESEIARKIAALPWELAHDGIAFLAQQAIPVVRVVRRVNRKSSVTENRALSLLFQACSPENTNVLDFEKEEALILSAAREPSIDLFTEETGTLDGLDQMIQTRAGIDAFHLSGHATLFDRYTTPVQWLPPGRSKLPDGTPVFLMENDIGECQLATADDLATYAFRDDWPKLVFVSGCRTGEQLGAVPSMAQKLVDKGAPAVIAWRRPVRDETATQAAREIYASLATGYTIEKSVARALKFLTQRKDDGAWSFPDWHLLQIYRDSGVLGALVTAPATHGRTKAHRIEPEKSFLGKKPVAGPDQFVGRRRPVQRCLRSLLEDKAIVLWGVGGLGKSSVAARLSRRIIQRFPDTKQVVIRGRLSERILRDRLRQEKHGEIFESTRGLSVLLAEFLELNKNLLMILDNFEDNQQMSAASRSGFVLGAEARLVLEILAGALSEGRGRLILTTRYWDADSFPPMGPCHAESLGAMAEAEVLKKQQRMELDLDETAAKSLAEASCGNPRFLETIAHAAANQRETLRAVYLKTSLRFEILWANLTPVERHDIARLAVSTLPLPLAAVEALGLDLTKAIALAVVEQSDDSRVVSAVARPEVPQLSEDDQIQIAEVVAPILDREWPGSAGFSIEQVHELLRLGLLADDAEVACANGVRLTNWLKNVNQWQEARKVCEAIIGRFSDHRIFNNLAIILYRLGETKSAVAAATRAVELCLASDFHDRAVAYASLGELQQFQGEPLAAIRSLENALACAEAMDREAAGSGSHNRAAILHNLAGVLAQQGDSKRALALWQESLTIEEENRNVDGRAPTLRQMAVVLARQGEVQTALELFGESLEIEEKTGNVLGKAATLHEKAVVLAERGEVRRALELWRESLEISERIGHRQGKAATLQWMGIVLARQGGAERALELWRESLEINERIGYLKGKAAALYQMAAALLQKGEVERALGLCYESLEINEKIGDVRGKAATLDVLGRAHRQSGDGGRALECYFEAARALASTGAYADLVKVIANIGLTDHERGAQWLAQTVWLARHIEVPYGMARLDVEALFHRLPVGHRLERNLALENWALTAQEEASSPMVKEAFDLVRIAAEGAHVAQRDLEAWLLTMANSDPGQIDGEIEEDLVALIGDTWLLDPTLVPQKSHSNAV